MRYKSLVLQVRMETLISVFPLEIVTQQLLARISISAFNEEAAVVLRLSQGHRGRFTAFIQLLDM